MRIGVSLNITLFSLKSFPVSLDNALVSLFMVHSDPIMVTMIIKLLTPHSGYLALPLTPQKFH